MSQALLIVTLLSGVCSTLSHAADSTASRAIIHEGLAERVDQFLDHKADSGFNGAVTVAINGRVVFSKGYGWADRKHEEPVTPDTRFWIASISKQFAAAAILKLSEQGQLSINDSIARFFPDAPPDKREITVHQLLTHTAGLEQHYAADGIIDRDRAVAAILSHPLEHAPGEAFGYSNDAYNLIAAIVEVRSGQSFEDYVATQLLRPAGLENTGFWGPADHPEVAVILYREDADSAWQLPNWGFRGGTGMFSTSKDLYRWYRALASETVLSQASRAQLLSQHIERGNLGVGYGWFQSSTPRGTTSVWTRGYEDFGHGAVLAAFPEEEVVIVITTNSGEWTDRGPVSHELAKELEGLVFSGK